MQTWQWMGDSWGNAQFRRMKLRWQATVWIEEAQVFGHFTEERTRKQVDGNRPSFNDKGPTFPQKYLPLFVMVKDQHIATKVVIWFSWHLTKIFSIHHANYSGTCGEIQHAEKVNATSDSSRCLLAGFHKQHRWCPMRATQTENGRPSARWRQTSGRENC